MTDKTSTGKRGKSSRSGRDKGRTTGVSVHKSSRSVHAPKGQRDRWAIGVDLGGTKIESAGIDTSGSVLRKILRPTDVKNGPIAVTAQIVDAVRQIRKNSPDPPAGVGVGVAGQIDPSSGLVIFGPNLNWHNVPLQSDLAKDLGLPVVVLNDVRAAAWGEWLYGSGRGCSDMVCVFVGTGIGGGVVSGGRMLTGCSNTAGEIGHLAIDPRGPQCTCGNRGCLEAAAGGWAISRRAQDAMKKDPSSGGAMRTLAGGRDDAVTAQVVIQAAHGGDPLARHIIDDAVEALIAGAVSLVNAFNPSRLVLGGGVIEGMPEAILKIEQGVRTRALSAAVVSFQVVPARLHGDAGIVGAGALAMQLQTVKGGS